MPIQITCDSACELPSSLARRYGIAEIPLRVTMGSESRLDKINIGAEEIYAYAGTSGSLPGIVPVSEETYEDCFRKYRDQGNQVLHISLSGKLSHCYEHAKAAAKKFENVSVIDSESISIGAGDLTLLAAELAGADYRLEELTSAINEMKRKMEASCLLQSSSMLKTGRRQGGFRACAEAFANWKPEISMRSGKIRHRKYFQGNMDQSIRDYLRSCLEGRSNIQTDRILLTHSGLSGDLLSQVRQLLLQLQPFEEILEVPASSVVSCRCGPGSLGLAYMTK